MTETLGARAWIAAPETQAVLIALQAEGGGDCARFVGGCVRNSLLGAPASDIDIATTLPPRTVMQALAAAGLKSVPTGIEHGTVTAVSGGRPYEITTLRRDVETDGRRAVVAFTTDWAEDAARRDFTMNALYADGEGRVFDPTGQGVADARAGRVVFVGDPATRLAEDYLRILRFFRFHAWYGKGAPDPAALAACAAAKDQVRTLAAERISKELLKLLGADDPRPAVELMATTGVLDAVLPGVPGLSRFDALVEIETDQLFTNDPELRLAALMPEDELATAKACEALRLSNDQRDRLVAAKGRMPRIVSWLSPRETRRAVYRLGHRAFADRVKLAWADSGRMATTPQWRDLLALGESWSAPAFPITGDEVLKAGVPKGPVVGEVLREVEEWWIDHDFIDDKATAIEKLKAVAQGMVY